MTSEVTDQDLVDTVFGASGNVESEVVEATVDTDGSGNGSPNLTDIGLLGDYEGTPHFVIGDVADGDGGAAIANATSSDFDITVSGSSTTSGTVDVRVVVTGRSV